MKEGHCLHEDRWEMLDKKLGRIEAKLDDHHKRVWIGNGTPALNVTLQKHDQILSGLVWVTGTVTAALVGVVAKLVFGRNA